MYHDHNDHDDEPRCTVCDAVPAPFNRWIANYLCADHGTAYEARIAYANDSTTTTTTTTEG